MRDESADARVKRRALRFGELLPESGEGLELGRLVRRGGGAIGLGLHLQGGAERQLCVSLDGVRIGVAAADGHPEVPRAGDVRLHHAAVAVEPRARVVAGLDHSVMARVMGGAMRIEPGRQGHLVVGVAVGIEAALVGRHELLVDDAPSAETEERLSHVAEPAGLVKAVKLGSLQRDRDEVGQRRDGAIGRLVDGRARGGRRRRRLRGGLLENGVDNPFGWVVHGRFSFCEPCMLLDDELLDKLRRRQAARLAEPVERGVLLRSEAESKERARIGIHRVALRSARAAARRAFRFRKGGGLVAAVGLMSSSGEGPRSSAAASVTAAAERKSAGRPSRRRISAVPSSKCSTTSPGAGPSDRKRTFGPSPVIGGRAHGSCAGGTIAPRA